MVFIRRSKTQVMRAGITAWMKLLTGVGFLTILFVGTPRIFSDHATLSGPDAAHADAPSCGSHGRSCGDIPPDDCGSCCSAGDCEGAGDCSAGCSDGDGSGSGGCDY